MARLSDEGPGAYTVPGTPVPARLSLSPAPSSRSYYFPFPRPRRRRGGLPCLFSVSARRGYIERSPLHGAEEQRPGVVRREKKVFTNLDPKRLFNSYESVRIEDERSSREQETNLYSSFNFQRAFLKWNFECQFNYQR